ncbi:hypothetical protein VDR48_19910 [Xanthomonas campestris pv. campestris]|nr:hypothetical protein [Xanthomonas campestris pv. campestris]MEB1789642.1 hypothetical protein [Xanthomonas campestris pv. campestris]MEB1844524.1 hypothetical protein [Xanthomonas campestris pv. campestris]MEB1878284.1 hypothetical protein [Xanthomonas campestris pv. campestris]
MDNIWNDQADRLEQALLAQTDALILHYLRTAEPASIEKLAGEALIGSDNTRAATIATLAARLNS